MILKVGITAMVVVVRLKGVMGGRRIKGIKTKKVKKSFFGVTGMSTER